MNNHPNSVEGKASVSEVGSTKINFEQIAESSPDIIFIYDQEQRRYIYCNQRVTDLFGYSKAEFLSLPVHEKESYIHPDDYERVQHWLDTLFEESRDDLPSIEYRAKHIDGSWRWLKVRVSASDRYPDGRLQKNIIN